MHTVRAGMLRVSGVMPPKCKMFDTPGVPHKFQLTSRLSADEVRPARSAQGSVPQTDVQQCTFSLLWDMPPSGVTAPVAADSALGC